MEKPTKVEVGQVWRHTRSTGPRTVEELSCDGTATFDTRSIGFAATMLADPEWTFLGGPQPPDTGEGPSPAGKQCLEQHRSGCVCTLARQHDGDHVAVNIDANVIQRWAIPQPASTIIQNPAYWNGPAAAPQPVPEAWGQWEGPCRDIVCGFGSRAHEHRQSGDYLHHEARIIEEPAQPVPEVVPPSVHVIPHIEPRPGFYGPGIGEMLSQFDVKPFEQSAPCQCGGKGVAVSALQAIQARKKPEPWVPSVDDWDLLPDV